MTHRCLYYTADALTHSSYSHCRSFSHIFSFLYVFHIRLYLQRRLLIMIVNLKIFDSFTYTDMVYTFFFAYKNEYCL